MAEFLDLGGASPASIIDSDTQGFAADVMEASRDTLVLVDFWADWCGPCKQLTPLLEKIVGRYPGRVSLVKINVDQNQQLAAQLRVQSLPTVMAFKDGRPVDGFMGAVPESQLVQFIDALLGGEAASPVEEVIEAGLELLDTGQPQQAAAALQQVLGVEPDNHRALAGMALAMLALNRIDDAQRFADAVPAANAEDALVKKARAGLTLAREAEDAGDLTLLEAAVAADPDDHQARFDLALAYQANGRMEAAGDALLAIFARDRDWNDAAARKQLVKLFEAAGPTDAFTLNYRRRLSSMMFS